MKTKRTFVCGFSVAILALVAVVSCDNDPDLGPSVYDFQAFLAGLPLGNLANDGAWPVWNTGQPGLLPALGGPNHLSVVAEPGGGRALRVPFGGAHGIDVLLTGANGVGAQIGYTLEIRGRIVVIETGAAAATQRAAIRSAGGQTINDNLVSVSITAGSSSFAIQRVIQAADLAAPTGAFPPGPTLRLVNEPSALSTVMFVTDILVFQR